NSNNSFKANSNRVATVLRAKWFVKHCGCSNIGTKFSRFAQKSFANRSRKAGNRPGVERLSMGRKFSIALTANWKRWNVPLVNEAVRSHQTGGTRPGRGQALSHRKGGPTIARRVMKDVRKALAFLGSQPGAGHLREDLTNRPVKFWPVYSYLIVYDPKSKP